MENPWKSEFSWKNMGDSWENLEISWKNMRYPSNFINLTFTNRPHQRWRSFYSLPGPNGPRRLENPIDHRGWKTTHRGFPIFSTELCCKCWALRLENRWVNFWDLPFFECPNHDLEDKEAENALAFKLGGPHMAMVKVWGCSSKCCGKAKNRPWFSQKWGGINYRLLSSVIVY